MSRPRLIYFDAPVSRGEECRLALHLAGVDFEDVRVKPADWPATKEHTPYGALPVLEMPGCPALAHSNAILVLIGRRHGLHPADDIEAARHEGMMRPGPYFGGEKIQVADLKIHMAVRWFIGGKVDHIPASVFAAYPRLMGVHDAVRDHPMIRSWYARA